MLRKSIVLLVLFSAVVLAGCGVLSGGGTDRTVSVTGTGSVSLPPNIVVVNIGVQTQGDNVAQAVAENNRRAEQVTEAILAAGVAQEDVRTTYFSVSPQQQYDPQGTPTGAVTYWVDNTVTATLRQVDQLGGLLEAALGAGANSINGVQYGVDDTSEAEVQARQLAMDDARQRAELLAAAAGETLGEPISISTSAGGQTFGGVYAVGGVGGGGDSVPVSAGSTEVQVQVYILYSLK